MDKDGLRRSIEQQAKYIASLRYEDLSDEVIKQAKLVLLDSIACMAAGNQEYSYPQSMGEYSLVGKGKCDKYSAVFVNACAMVKNEMDEGNQFAFGHPACHIIPALLAESQDIHTLSGRNVITALVAAYEVSCRWGCAARAKASMHVHGTMQTAGAAAVAARLHQCSAAQIEKSIILANSLPQPSSWSSAFHGDQIRNAYVGLSNEIGLNSMKMVCVGVESSLETLISVWEDILDGSIDDSALIKDLGKDYLIVKNYFKVHAACRYTHSFVDSVTEFEKHGLEACDIERIDIETYHAAAKLNGQEARNSFAAKFSIPVALAVRLIYGELSVESLTDEHIKSEEVIDLAKRIYVQENLSYNALLPDIRKNRIVITKRDGSVTQSESSVTKGDFMDPFSEADVKEKFISLTKNVWDSEKQKQIMAFVDRLDETDNIQDLFELIGNRM